jgi:hypothetical protein
MQSFSKTWYANPVSTMYKNNDKIKKRTIKGTLPSGLFFSPSYNFEILILYANNNNK